jgi:hypothetical protein
VKSHERRVRENIRVVHQGGHLASGQGFGETPERLWVIDPVGSWSLVQEESGPLISQGGISVFRGPGKREGESFDSHTFRDLGARRKEES